MGHAERSNITGYHSVRYTIAAVHRHPEGDASTILLVRASPAHPGFFVAQGYQCLIATGEPKFGTVTGGVTW
jgi:hypothetical protein